MLPPAKPLPPHLQAIIDAGKKAAAEKAASPGVTRNRTNLADKRSNGFDVPIVYARKSLWKKYGYGVLALLLIAAAYYEWRHTKAYDKLQTSISEPAPASTFTPSKMDHLVPTQAAGEVQLVHGQFSVRDYKSFSFVVPAHTFHPRVHGHFELSAGQNAAVDAMLMDEDQYQSYIEHKPSDVISSQENSHGATIDWAVHPTVDDPRTYYLVFANASSAPAKTPVHADFTVSLQ